MFANHSDTRMSGFYPRLCLLVVQRSIVSRGKSCSVFNDVRRGAVSAQLHYCGRQLILDFCNSV